MRLHIVRGTYRITPFDFVQEFVTWRFPSSYFRVIPPRKIIESPLQFNRSLLVTVGPLICEPDDFILQGFAFRVIVEIHKFNVNKCLVKMAANLLASRT